MPVAPGGYKWVLTGIDAYSGLGFVYPVVYANAQNTIKGLKQKILYRFRPPSYVSSDQGMHFTAHGVQQWARRHPIRWTCHVAYHPQSSGLIENWNRLWEHWLSKMGDKGTRGWLTCLQERVLTLNVRRVREGRFLCFSRGLGKVGLGEGASALFCSSPHHHNFVFS